MYQLNRELEKGKVIISTSPYHVGELHLTFPVFDKIGRVTNQVPLILTNGKQVNIADTFTTKQIQGSNTLLNALRDGKVVLHTN
jgi:hypothetical protein